MRDMRILNKGVDSFSASLPPLLSPQVLADISKNGIGAAMKYMSNPKVMTKIQSLMGPMMGRK